MCKWARVEDNDEDDEEETRGQRKRARPEVVIAGPSRAVVPLENTIRMLLERMTEHLLDL